LEEEAVMEEFESKKKSYCPSLQQNKSVINSTRETIVGEP